MAPTLKTRSSFSSLMIITRGVPPSQVSLTNRIGAMNVIAVTTPMMQPTILAKAQHADHATGTSQLHARTTFSSANPRPSAISAIFPFTALSAWHSIYPASHAAKRGNAWTVEPSTLSTENTLTVVDGRNVTVATTMSPLRPIAVPFSRPLNLLHRNKGMLLEPPPAKPYHLQNLCTRTLSAC